MYLPELIDNFVWLEQVVVVVDDEDRENEGDLIMAAEVMTPEAMAFFVQHTTGIVCAGVKGEILDRLQIPLMVPDKDNEEALLTAFTVTVVITQLSVRTICNCGCSPTTIWKGAYCTMIAFNCDILAPLKWEQKNY
jgi:3,4-dihydroxy-2-butanone 4-phosphate synthase